MTDADATEHSQTKDEEDIGRPFSEMQDAGLLWLINRQVFHPRGYALAFHKWPEGHEDAGRVTGWSILGDGKEPWNFTDGEENDFLEATKRELP